MAACVIVTTPKEGRVLPMDRPQTKLLSTLGLGVVLATAGSHGFHRPREIPPSPPLTRDDSSVQFHSDPKPLQTPTNGPSSPGGGPIGRGGSLFGPGGARGAGGRGQVGEPATGFPGPAGDTEKVGEISQPPSPNL